MDALILCGGFATRLEPITLYVPKPLLPIGGRPILDNIADDVAKAPDVERIIVSANKKFEGQFRYWAENKMASGFGKKLELLIEPTMDHGNKLGAIRGIEYAIENANIKEDLMIIAGDNFYKWSVSDAIEHFKKSGRKATICVHDVGSKEDARKLGIVKMKGDVIIEFEEKPDNPSSTLASTGIYIYPRELLPKFREYLEGKNNPDAPGYFLKWLINKTEVHAVVHRGEWYDIGTLETYSKVYSLFNSSD